jgi:hypothetical protein
MLMMLNSGYLMETSVAAYSIPNILPARDFDLVLDVMRLPSREGSRMNLYCRTDYRQRLLVSPLMRGYLHKKCSVDSNSRLYWNLGSYFGEFNYWPS